MKRIVSLALVGLLVAGCAGAAFNQAMAQAGADIAVPPAMGPDGAPAAGGPPPMPAPVVAHTRPDATGGEALYVLHCAMCHGPNGMGTGLLGRTRDAGLLEARGDLPAVFVVTAARIGIGNMPAIPRGEVTDEEMQAIGQYLAAGPHIGGPQ